MKKRILIGTLIVFAAVALVVVFSGCELTLVLFSNISGKVVNAKAPGSESDWWNYGGYSTEGIVVGIYPENSAGTGFSDDAEDTDTVDSTGRYYLGSVEPGRYKIEGTKASSNDDWIIVPRIVTLSGSGMDLPPLIAYPNPTGEADNDLLIFLSWESTDHDLDAHLTYATLADGSTRSDVYWDSQTSSVGNIELERDIREAPATDASYPRVETIIVRDAPYTDDENSGTIYDMDNIPTNQLRFYVDCNNYEDLSITGDTEQGHASAWGQVDVMYGSDHYGTWVLPYNTNEDTLWVVTIDAGPSNAYTIYSAGNVIYDNIKSITGNTEVMTAVPVDEIR